MNQTTETTKEQEQTNCQRQIEEDLISVDLQIHYLISHAKRIAQNGDVVAMFQISELNRELEKLARAYGRM